MKMKMKELVISGGGAKGYAFVGAIAELKKQGELDDLEKVSCVSIGSIIAVALCMGLDMKGFQQRVFDTNVVEMLDPDLKGIIERKSVLKGEKYRGAVSAMIQDNDGITMKQLFDRSGILLSISVACVDTKSLVYVSHLNFPGLKVIDAALMSSAIPGVFPPVMVDGLYYVDGAVLEHIPSNLCPYSAYCICCCSDDKSPEGFFKSLLSMMDASNNANVYINRIEIDTGDIPVTAFDISKNTKLTLIMAGKRAARKHVHRTV